MKDQLQACRASVSRLCEGTFHKVDSIKVEAQLGHSTWPGGTLDTLKPEHWHPDEMLYTVSCRAYKIEGWPSRNTDNPSEHFTASSVHHLEEALDDLEAAVAKKSIEWKMRVAEDNDFATKINRGVTCLRKWHINNMKPFREIERGTRGRVIDHRPGVLRIQFEPEMLQTWVPIWAFTCTASRAYPKGAPVGSCGPLSGEEIAKAHLSTIEWRDSPDPIFAFHSDP